MFDYRPETGEFIWRIQCGQMLPGKVAGSLGSRGYWYITVNKQPFLAHRLVFLWMTGNWPAGVVDHINWVKTDNRWENLRDVSQMVNLQNRSTPYASNKCGYLGVRRHQDKWRARIKVAGKEVDLGCHATPEIAHQAYLEAKRRLHAGCTI